MFLVSLHNVFLISVSSYFWCLCIMFVEQTIGRRLRPHTALTNNEEQTWDESQILMSTFYFRIWIWTGHIWTIETYGLQGHLDYYKVWTVATLDCGHFDSVFCYSATFYETRLRPAFSRLGLGGSSGGYSSHGKTSHASIRACGGA